MIDLGSFWAFLGISLLAFYGALVTSTHAYAAWKKTPRSRLWAHRVRQSYYWIVSLGVRTHSALKALRRQYRKPKP